MKLIFGVIVGFIASMVLAIPPYRASYHELQTFSHGTLQSPFNLNLAIISMQSTLHKTFSSNGAPLHDSQSFSQLFSSNKKDWAALHHYDFVNNILERDFSSMETTLNDEFDRSRYWIQIDVLKTNLQRYDWICWLDMDTIIVDVHFSMENHIQKSLLTRPQVDLIIQSSKGFDGVEHLESCAFCLRNSYWSRVFLDQLKEVVAEKSWESFMLKTTNSHVNASTTDVSLMSVAMAFLLESDHHSTAHVFFTKMHDRWDQPLVYLPKIDILDFGGCLMENHRCLDVLRGLIDHLLNKEKSLVYRWAPHIQHIYNIFVVIYSIFALDRFLHITAFYFWPKRAALEKVSGNLCSHINHKDFTSRAQPGRTLPESSHSVADVQ